MIKKGFITLGELKKKCLTYSQIVLIMKFLRKMERDLKRVSNLIKKSMIIVLKTNLDYTSWNEI